MSTVSEWYHIGARFKEIARGLDPENPLPPTTPSLIPYGVYQYVHHIQTSDEREAIILKADIEAQAPTLPVRFALLVFTHLSKSSTQRDVARRFTPSKRNDIRLLIAHVMAVHEKEELLQYLYSYDGWFNELDAAFVVDHILLDPRVSVHGFGVHVQLLLASKFGRYGVVDALLRDPRVNPAQDDSIALVAAACNGHDSIVKRLLDDGRADPSDQHHRAVYCAIERGYYKVFNLLMSDRRVLSTIDLHDVEAHKKKHGYKNIRRFFVNITNR